MLKEQASPFWNAETFYSQIITSTSPYIVFLKNKSAMANKAKNVEKAKNPLFRPN